MISYSKSLADAAAPTRGTGDKNEAARQAGGDRGRSKATGSERRITAPGEGGRAGQEEEAEKQRQHSKAVFDCNERCNTVWAPKKPGKISRASELQQLRLLPKIP